jgi:dihydrofolate reductase
MRTVTYGGAVSLDGFLADAAEAVDWLHFSKDVQQEMTEFWKHVDTILMGRKTWDVAAKYSEADTPDVGPMRSYVFSRTLKAIDKPGVELVSSDAVAFVRDLKQRPGKGICLMGGGELAQSLIAAGLVDEVGLNIHPILLGSGIPVFRDPGHRVPFKLTECRQLDGGCVLVKYTLAQR